jgi:hypothetical protein
METHSLPRQSSRFEVGIYECEIHLKFRLIEEKAAINDRERLLEILMDAFSCGADDYMETHQVQVEAHEIPEMKASPRMRRKLIRLRNSKD